MNALVNAARVNLGLDEFIARFSQEPRSAGFTKATVTAWRVARRQRPLRPTDHLNTGTGKCTGEPVERIRRRDKREDEFR